MKKDKMAPTIGSTKRRPNLFLAESRLARAYGALDAIDPECELTSTEQEAILATYVDREAVLETRDEFRDFCQDVEDVIEAKLRRAKEYTDAAGQMANRLEHMKQGVARMMDATKVDELRGTDGAIVLKKSSGSVDVFAPTLVPKKWWRLPDNAHLNTIRVLVADLEKVAFWYKSECALDPDHVPAMVDEMDEVKAARKTLADLEAELRAVDKKAVLDAWKANGGKDYVEERDEAMIEELVAAREAGAIAQEELVEKSLAAVRRVPLVPGCAKVVKLSLLFK